MCVGMLRALAAQGLGDLGLPDPDKDRCRAGGKDGPQGPGRDGPPCERGTGVDAGDAGSRSLAPAFEWKHLAALPMRRGRCREGCGGWPQAGDEGDGRRGEGRTLAAEGHAPRVQPAQGVDGGALMAMGLVPIANARSQPHAAPAALRGRTPGARRISDGLVPAELQRNSIPEINKDGLARPYLG